MFLIFIHLAVLLYLSTCSIFTAVLSCLQGEENSSKLHVNYLRKIKFWKYIYLKIAVYIDATTVVVTLGLKFPCFLYLMRGRRKSRWYLDAPLLVWQGGREVEMPFPGVAWEGRHLKQSGLKLCWQAGPGRWPQFKGLIGLFLPVRVQETRHYLPNSKDIIFSIFFVDTAKI